MRTLQELSRLGNTQIQFKAEEQRGIQFSGLIIVDKYYISDSEQPFFFVVFFKHSLNECFTRVCWCI